jgi:hypothetical protein
MSTGWNKLVVIAILLLISSVRESHSQNLERVELFRHPGQQWLSWTSGERENFVYGYIQGYGHGMSEACLAADDLFEKHKPHAIGHDSVASTFPSARCRASVAQYKNVKVDPSKGPDFGLYTTAITEFYTKYSHYRDTPITDLLELLAGRERLTADDLYAKLGAPRKPKP